MVATSPIPRIGDVATVHDLAEEVTQIRVGYVLIHVEVVANDGPADPQVTVVERVSLGVSLRTEATTANDERMEEAKREDDALVLLLLLALLDVLRAELTVRSAEVALQVRRSLVSDLDASL